MSKSLIYFVLYWKMRNVIYFMYFFLVHCSIKAEENTFQNITKGVNKWSSTTRIKEYICQPRSPSSESPIAKHETTAKYFISEDYTLEFKGCFEILTYSNQLWRDGFFTKALTQNFQRSCFEWCVNNYLWRFNYFSISKEFCQCFNFTFPSGCSKNMSYCGGEACGRFGQCNGTSSYIGVFEILDVKPIHANNGLEDEKDESITLSRDLLIAIATPVCCVIATLVGLIICLIKRITHFRKKLLRNISTSAEMPDDFEVRSFGITSQRRGTATNLVEINNDIYNSQDIISPLPNPHPMRNCGTAVNIEQADDVSSDATSSDAYQITHLRKKLLGNLGVRAHGITSQRRGTATSLVEINNDIYNDQDIASPLPNPHPMRNSRTAVNIEQADDVGSDAVSSNDYQETGFPREPLCHQDASNPMPPGFESVDLSKSSEHRGSVTSMADTNKEAYHYQEIGLLPPTPHRMRNVGSVVGMEQTDDVNSDTADNDYQSRD